MRKARKKSQTRSHGLSRRAYAAQAGVSEATVRKHLRSGLLRPALLPNGKIDATKADELLARQRTRGTVSAALSDARRRKLAAQVALLTDEVVRRQESLCRRDEADEEIRTMLCEIVRGLRPNSVPDHRACRSGRSNRLCGANGKRTYYLADAE